MCKENGRSWCTNALKKYVDQFYPTDRPDWVEEAITAAGSMTCDEFPFASSVEGGDLVKGVRVCVPRDDNNWQGTTMGKYFKKGNRNYIALGEKYAIEIAGWDCDKQAPTPIVRARKLSTLAPRDAFTDEALFRSGGKCLRVILSSPDE